MKKYLITLFTFSLIVASLFTNTNGVSKAVSNEEVLIQSNEQVTPVRTFNYGDGENEVGFKPNGTEGDIGTGATSFFIRNNTFYVLDNVNKRVLVSSPSGENSIIPLSENTFLSDIYVSKDKQIYVLDTKNRIIHKVSPTGINLEEFSIPDVIEVPTGIQLNKQQQLIVDQAQDISFNYATQEVLYSARATEETEVAISEKRLNEKKGSIVIGKEIIPVDFEESYGAITVHSVKPNQIVYSKTEVAADIPVIMAETFVHVTDKKGRELGSVRIPLEDMYFAPRHLVRVSNGQIYLLSPQENQLVIYELKPGKKVTKKLKNRINEYKMNNKKEMELVNTNPILQESGNDFTIMANTGVNGFLHRADALSRANAMINHSWVVNSGNKVQASTTKLPGYVSSASAGTTLTGIPYKWGGADGKDYGAGGRSTFAKYQATDKIQAGDVNTSKSGGLSSVTGVDCSGFVQLAWLRIDKKYNTSMINTELTFSITKTNLKYMDALNQAGFHVVLFNGNSSSGIYTKEATVDEKEKAQSLTRTWNWLEVSNNFKPRRYNRIADDGSPLPQQY